MRPGPVASLCPLIRHPGAADWDCVHPYLFIPLGALLGCAIAAGYFWANYSQHPANRRFAWLMLATAWWAICELAWNSQGDPQKADFWLRLAALGWVWATPLPLDLLLSVGRPPSRRWRYLLRAAYLGSLALVPLEWATPWVHPGVQKASWGFSYTVGPAFTAYVAVLTMMLPFALLRATRELRRGPSAAEREQRSAMALVGLIPFVGGMCVDAVLPIFDIQLPRVGALSLAILGVWMCWTTGRYGFTVLAPGFLSREILDGLPDGVALVDASGSIRSANAAFARLVGAERGTLLRSRAETVLGSLSDRSAIEIGDEVEGQLRSSDGKPRPVGLRRLPVNDRKQNEIGWLIILRDLREVVELRRQLLVAGRLAAAGQLAAGIAHEVANPLAYVTSNLGLLRSHWDRLLDSDGAPVSEAEREVLRREGDEIFEETGEGVQRVTAIVNDIRSFTHGEPGTAEVDLCELVERSLRFARPHLHAGIEIERNLAPHPRVVANAREIEQVVLNLIVNAIQAIGERGTLRLAIEPVGDRVAVVVEDDGCGIQPDDLERVFDPFFTTKPVGKGTGLGLAISYEITRRHGGTLSVDSQPGRGTRITLALPAAPPDLEQS